MVYEAELEESIKNSMTQTWSHLVDLSNGIKGLGGGGCGSQVLKMRRTVKNEKEIEKKEKRGGETRQPETKAGRKPPSRLQSLVSFRNGFLG